MAPLGQLTSWLDSVDELPFDTETFGLDPHTKELMCIQVGDYDNQYIFDCLSLDPLILKPYLEAKLIIAQNIAFDLKFLYKVGIFPKRVFDTFLAEKVLNCGINNIRAGLDHLTDRYCDVKLDKSVRVDIPKEGLTPRVISYAADDVKYLLKIKEQQVAKLRSKDLIRVADLENQFVKALAYLEYCGFKLDEDKWRAKMKKDQRRLCLFLEQLNAWIFDRGMQKYIEQQLDMFRPQECTINWSSPKQVSELFTELGMDCTVEENGKTKVSVEESVINKYAKDYKLVQMYLRYKGIEKVIGTYGQSFLDQINPSTGRLHTRFSQIMSTGRTSSGGTDKETKTKFVNFQNIPADKETRACFVAEPGNTLIVSDYSGQEAIVLANYSLDPVLLNFYDEGLADMHSFVASKMYPELEGLTLEEIKGQHKNKRQAAKTVGFSVVYGGEGSTIAANINISVEEGNAIYEAYFKAFPGLKNYFKRVQKETLDNGFVTISPLTRRKSYFSSWKQFEEFQTLVKAKGFWTRYKEAKEFQYPEFKEMSYIVRNYFKMKGEYERIALNYPIQGSSGEIMKIATIYVFDWIMKNGLFGIVKIVNSIHDELVVECPEDMAEDVAEVVEKYMFKAGTFFCKRVPLKAVPEITKFWKK